MSETEAPAGDAENTLLMEIEHGTVTIKLRPDLAPLHVERIKTLARQGSEMPDLPAEFSEPSRARFLRGVCGMARTSNPDSANSQFFIMFAPIPSLDGQYTIWGEVAAGMDAVDKIKRGSGGSGMVQGPDRIRSMKVAADIS